MIILVLSILFGSLFLITTASLFFAFKTERTRKKITEGDVVKFYVGESPDHGKVERIIKKEKRKYIVLRDVFDNKHVRSIKCIY